MPPGRNVRCAKCQHVWFQAAPEPEPTIELPSSFPEPEPAPVPEANIPQAPAAPSLELAAPVAPAAMQPRSRRRRRSGSNAAQAVGWAALVLLAVSTGWASVQFRQPIVDIWPQSASLYGALGMPVTVRGITLSNIGYQQEVEDGQPVLAVTGKLVNVSDRELPVPVIRIVLTDDAKREIYHWTFDAGIPSLKPGAESSFVTRLASPPPEARNLNIRFAEAGEPR